MTRRTLTPVSLAFALLWSTGCLSWFSDAIATGIARLTVRNVGAVTTLTNGDSNCGFSSNAVLSSFTQDGPTGGSGTVTYRVEKCVISLPELTQFSEDCNGTIKSASGSITVTATKTVRGRLTGDPESPVVPDGPDAGTFHFEQVSFQDFHVTDSSSEKSLMMWSGSFSATVQPMLVASADKGTCSIATPNTAFTAITYTNAHMEVRTPDRDIDVDVQTSSLDAQAGVNGDRSNWFGGNLTLWEGNEPVPEEDDTDGLDPEYDPNRFKNGYLCADNLAIPETTSCDLTARMGHGAARLSVRTFAGVMKAVANETTCGFGSQPVLDNYTTSGLIGQVGQLTYSIDSPCQLNFPVETVVGTDCMGVETRVIGRVAVTGTKTVTGYLTGDPETPVVPNSRTPALLDLSAALTNFTVIDTSSTLKLEVKSGRLSGNLAPRMALDTETGACSIATPVAEIGDITWSGASVTLVSDAKRFDLQLDSSRLDAVNGNSRERTNHLAGSITVAGTPVVVPVHDSALNPDYNQVLFDQSYACTAGMEMPVTDEDCSFTKHLAQNAARLIIKGYGVIGKRSDDDGACGFGSIDGILPADLSGDPLGEVTATWQINSCLLDGSDAPLHIAEDCNRENIYIEGTASVTSSKIVQGELALGYPPIEPRHREAARVEVHEVVLQNFSVKQYEADATEPGPYLELVDGTLSGFTNPVTGQSLSKPDAYFIKTPVAHFEHVRLTNARGYLHSGAKTFELTFQDSDLDAFNGSYQYRTNELTGSITMNGEQVQLPINERETQLDPDYDQAYFDGSYVCKEDLKETVPPADYYQTP